LDIKVIVHDVLYLDARNLDFSSLYESGDLATGGFGERLALLVENLDALYGQPK
jgi:hypothetical protein